MYCKAGLFSAVSSAFVLDVQSSLQPDSGKKLETYLQAILLTLNPTIPLDEIPAAPPDRDDPPEGIFGASGLLYASLLVSLFAAFVAMLGKQWLNRYLRHSGGSITERCGDRQRKFDGLEKWHFRFFIESLPVMLQISLFLLTCGLSQYMWPANKSAARVVMFFIVFCFLFYVGIVIAGASSYECPFQTPASIALRHLIDNWPSLDEVISLTSATQRSVRELLAKSGLPNVTSLMYATWMDARLGFISISHSVYNIARRPSSWKIPTSRIVASIGRMARGGGHKVCQALWSAAQKLTRRIRSFGREMILPITRGPDHTQKSVGLLVPVRDLDAHRKQNTDNARCVCWILQKITDPEAIDSAICLAGVIRWFDGGSAHDPPYDLIISIFEACFDSAHQLYPGMRDRAYFSARAILNISIGARVQSHERASAYPIPVPRPSTSYYLDPDFRHILEVLKHNSHDHQPTINFPIVGGNAYTHSLWISNFFVELTRPGPNPTLRSYGCYLTAATTSHRATIANVLLVWYMLLGGQVEEETFWVVDKSYGVVSSLSTSVYLLLFMSAIYSNSSSSTYPRG